MISAINNTTVYYLDGREWKVFPFKDRISLIKQIYSTLKDSKGILWIGSSDVLTRITEKDTTLFFRDFLSNNVSVCVRLLYFLSILISILYSVDKNLFLRQFQSQLAYRTWHENKYEKMVEIQSSNLL